MVVEPVCTTNDGDATQRGDKGGTYHVDDLRQGQSERNI